MSKKIFATAINCMDGRVQTPVIEYLQHQYGADYGDMVTEPGSNKILAESINFFMIDMFSEKQMINDAYNLLLTLANRYPTDFFIQLQCGKLLQILGYNYKNQEMLELSQKYYEKAVIANRFKGQFAQMIYSQTMQSLMKEGGN